MSASVFLCVMMHIEISDKVLWQHIKNDDSNALTQLFQRYYFLFTRKGLQYVQDPELIKDAINEVFYNLWRSRHTLSDIENVKAYLHAVFRNQVFAFMKSDLKYANNVKAWDQVQETTQLSYEDVLVALQVKQEQKEQLHKAFALLSPRQKEYIQLKYFEGLSYLEVAERTGQSIKTVYNTIYEGIKVLRREISL